MRPVYVMGQLIYLIFLKLSFLNICIKIDHTIYLFYPINKAPNYWTYV